MSVQYDELKIRSKEPEQQINEIEQWARKLVEHLNYSINHLDETNFVKDISEKIKGSDMKEIKEKMNEQYGQLRELIIKRTS